jgi:hypothetical protein
MLKANTLKQITQISLLRGKSSFQTQSIRKAFSSVEHLESVTRKLVDTAVKTSNLQEKDAKFNEFSQKIWKVYESEMQRGENSKRRDQEFSLTTITSRTPLKDTLRIYEAFQGEGFDDDHVTASISQVAKVLRIFQEKPSYYHDLKVIYLQF